MLDDFKVTEFRKNRMEDYVTGLGRTKYKFSIGLSYINSLSAHQQNNLKGTQA
jgi:hypothetical protein